MLILPILLLPLLAVHLPANIQVEGEPGTLLLLPVVDPCWSISCCSCPPLPLPLPLPLASVLEPLMLLSICMQARSRNLHRNPGIRPEQPAPCSCTSMCII